MTTFTDFLIEQDYVVRFKTIMMSWIHQKSKFLINSFTSKSELMFLARKARKEMYN